MSATWACMGSTLLARDIRAICRVTQDAAEDRAARAVDHGEHEFETVTVLRHLERTGREVTRWRATYDKATGVGTLTLLAPVGDLLTNGETA